MNSENVSTYVRVTRHDLIYLQLCNPVRYVYHSGNKYFSHATSSTIKYNKNNW